MDCHQNLDDPPWATPHLSTNFHQNPFTFFGDISYTINDYVHTETVRLIINATYCLYITVTHLILLTAACVFHCYKSVSDFISTVRNYKVTQCRKIHLKSKE